MSVLRKGALLGARAGIRDLDRRFASIRRQSGLVPANAYTLANAALGDREARARIVSSVRSVPSKIRLRTLDPIRPRVLTAAARGESWAEKAVEKGARKAVVWLGTRPKLARFLPGPV